MKIKTLIVDDETSAITIMQKILLDKFSEDIQLIGTANSAEEAIIAIDSKKPDLVLLDIAMPKRDGFDVLNAFPDQTFKVVFVTAHEEYAIKALRSNAMDYLLKPVDLDDIKNMIENYRVLSPDELVDEDERVISIRNTKGWIYLRKGDIIYVENRRGIPHFIMQDGQIFTSSKRIREYEEILGDTFYRVHNSYLVNVSKIHQYNTSEGGEAILNNGDKIPVSRRRGAGLVEIMKKLS